MAGRYDYLIPQQDAAPAGRYDYLIPQQDAASAQEQPPSTVSAPVAPEPAEPTNGTLRALKLGVQGVGRGLASVPGGVVDLTTAAMNMLPGVDIKNPVGGTNWITDKARQLAQAVGYTPETPQTPAERIAGKAIEFGTSALAGGAGLLKAAPTATSGLMRSLTEPYASAPGAALVGDLAAGAGSGAAVGVLNDALPGNHPLAEMVAGLAGGAGGMVSAKMATAPARYAANLLTDLAQPAIPGGQPGRGTVNKAADIMQEAASNPTNAAQDIRAAQADARANEYLPATPGLVSNDVGLVGLERRLRATTPQVYALRDAEVQNNASGRIADIAPRDADPNAARFEVQQQANTANAAAQDVVREQAAQLDAAKQGISALDEQGKTAIGAVYPPEGPTAAKQTASRDFATAVVDNGLTPMTTEKNARFDNPISANTPVPLDALSKVVKDVRDGLSPLLNAGHTLPADAMKAIDNLAGKNEPTTWGDLSKLRRNLSSMREDARKGGAFELADNIRALQSGIDAEADRIIAQGGDAGAALKEAQQYYRDVYAPVFAQGQGQKLRDAVQRGKDPDPSAILNRYYLTGKETPGVIEDLGRIIGVSKTPEEAKDAVRRYVVADMASVMDPNTGAVNLRTLKKWQENRAALLSDPRFSDIAQEVNGFVQQAVNRSQRRTELSTEVANYAEALRNAEKSASDTQARYQRGTLGIMLGKDPAIAARSILDSDNPVEMMQQAVDAVKRNPDALAGWKRAVSEAVARKMTTTRDTLDGGRTINIDSLTRVLDDNRAALSKVYSPAEMNTLESVRRQLAAYQNLDIPASAMAKPTPLLEELLTQVAPVVRESMGGFRGGNMLANARAVLKNWVPNDNKGVMELLTRATTDPEVATVLLERNLDRIKSPSFQKRLNLLVNARGAATTATEEQ